MKTIERLRELEKSATTPRPWKPEEVGEAFRWFRKMGDHNTFTTQDGELAAAAVNAIPALLAVVEAQAAEIAAWRYRPMNFTDPNCTFTLADADALWDRIVRAKQTTDAAIRAMEGEAQ